MVLVSNLVPPSTVEGGGKRGRRTDFIGFLKLNSRVAVHEEEKKSKSNEEINGRLSHFGGLL